MKTDFFQRVFEKNTQIQISQKSLQWQPRCSCGRTDWHDEANSRISKSYERAWKQILRSSNRNIRQSQWPRGLRRWLWGRSPAEMVGSNPTRGIDVCLLWVLCVVRWRSVRRADHSSRGVVLTVLGRCVWSRNLVNEEALADGGLSRQTKPYSQHRCCQPTAG